MNDICKECGHHWLSHVIYGSKGHGCQELVGESELGNCGCETFVPTMPKYSQALGFVLTMPKCSQALGGDSSVYRFWKYGY